MKMEEYKMRLLWIGSQKIITLDHLSALSCASFLVVPSWYSDPLWPMIYPDVGCLASCIVDWMELITLKEDFIFINCKSTFGSWGLLLWESTCIARYFYCFYMYHFLAGFFFLAKYSWGCVASRQPIVLFSLLFLHGFGGVSEFRQETNFSTFLNNQWKICSCHYELSRDFYRGSVACRFSPLGVLTGRSVLSTYGVIWSVNWFVFIQYVLGLWLREHLCP